LHRRDGIFVVTRRIWRASYFSNHAKRLEEAMRLLTAAAAVAAGLLVGAFAGAAAAHVTANPGEGPADGYFRAALRVPHGCEGSPTVAVRVRIPAGLRSVKPQVKPGWEITITKRKLDRPVDAGHGRMITETVDEVAWRGGPLPDAYFDEFGLSMRLPATPGKTLYFPTVQECANGVERWIEIPAAGQKRQDLDKPAPSIRLIDKKKGP
jgi:periplasmic copper chaperone A